MIVYLVWLAPAKISRSRPLRIHVHTWTIQHTIHNCSMEIKIGALVELKEHPKAEVRYVGDIHIRPGTWIGAELPTPTGKNDGSIKGERYFECPPQHGVFVPETGVVRVLAQPAPKPAPKAATPKPTAKPRPSSVGTSSAATAKPSARLSTIGLSKNLKRTSIQPTPPPARSNAQSPAQTTRPTAPSTVRPSAQPSTLAAKRQSLAGSSQSYAGLRTARKPSLSSPSSTAPTRTAAPSTASSSATTKSKDPRLQTLETENTHLKKQNAHIQEQLTAANQAKVERDRFEAIVQKLQSKCQNYHQEHVDLKAIIREKETELDAANKEREYNETNHEMAVLDKETAELKFEQMEAERDALDHQLEVIRLELEIAEEQVAMFNEDLPPEERTAAASSIVQKENERLRNTIRRMYEDTEDLKREYTKRISELEKAVGDTDALREEIGLLQEQDAVHESTIVDLMDRVRAADASESTIEELSYQNQQLLEQAVQKDATIEQYVTLKELSDEVEIQLVDRVRELLDENDMKDLELADCHRQMNEDATNMANQDLLIGKLREFVLDTQSSMSQVETMKTMSEDNVKKMTERFNEAMEMNRAMRNARINDMGKTIDTELTRLAAGEAREELDILKQYLPDSSSAEYTNNSIRAYFQAKKIAFKASLVRSQLAVVDVTSLHGLEQALSDIYRCDVAVHFEQIHLYAEYIHTTAERCTLDQFRMVGTKYDQMSDTEKMMERTLTCFKQDDINLRDLAESSRGHAEVMNRVSFMEESRPDCELILHASLIRSNLERIRGAFDAVRSAFTSSDLQDASDSLLVAPTVVNECIASASKLVQVLTALQSDGLYPVYEAGVQELDDGRHTVELCAKAVQQITHDFVAFLANEDAKSLATSDVIKNYHNFVKKQELPDLQTTLKEIRTRLVQWTEYASVLMNTAEVESFTPPWELKAREIEAKKRVMLDAEKKLTALAAEHQATLIQIREREEIIDTKELEIEHLRAKNKDFLAKTEEHQRLASEWSKATEELISLRNKVVDQQTEIERLQDESQRLPAAEPIVVPARDQAPAAETPPPTLNVPSSFGTFVQALSEENRWLRRRENTELFEHKLITVFSSMHNHQIAQARTHLHHKQVQASGMLDMMLTMHGPPIPETFQLPPEQDNNDFKSGKTPDWKSTPITRNEARIASSNRRCSPLHLKPIQTSFCAKSMPAAPELSLVQFEDFSFMDLSPLAEDFDMMQDLEGFGQTSFSVDPF
jgi:dynactin 1